MIYLFQGSDVEKVRAKAFAWAAAARAKAPDAPYIRLSADAITPDSLSEVIQSQGLFFSKMLVLLDDPFALAEAGEAVLDALPQLRESQNPIAIVAPKPLAARAKKLEAVAEKVFKIDVVEKKPARGFNSALVNALGARDRAGLWKELMRAQRQGDVPEMLHGLLHWKARDLMSKGGRGWSAEEARELSRSLIELVSSARSGDLPLSLALERFALSI
jgi:DNA polymerase III delta subunit